MRLSVGLLMVLLLLSGCDGPRTTMVPKDEAKRDERVLRVRVVQVYDNKDRHYTREFNISHVIDVDVLDGPEGVAGTSLALPFDQFYVARPPPKVGDEVLTTPAAWVTRARAGKTGGFNR